MYLLGVFVKLDVMKMLWEVLSGVGFRVAFKELN